MESKMISQRIRHYRRMAKLSQEALADKVDVSETYGLQNGKIQKTASHVQFQRKRDKYYGKLFLYQLSLKIL